MDYHRETRPSRDRRDPGDPRNRQGKNAKRKRKKHGKTFKVVMTIVLIFVITAAMLLCMAAAYIKNVIIPNAGLEMTAYDLNLTSTILCKDPETGAYKVNPKPLWS